MTTSSFIWQSMIQSIPHKDTIFLGKNMPISFSLAFAKVVMLAILAIPLYLHTNRQTDMNDFWDFLFLQI